MIYDKIKHCDLVYNELQTVGAYNQAFTREYYAKYSEQVRNANNGKAVVSVNNFKEFGIGALVLLLSLIAGLVLSLIIPCGRHLVFHMGAAALCGYIGYVMITSSKSFSPNTWYKDRTEGKVLGSILIAEAAAILIMWFNLPFATDWECSYFMAGTFLIVMSIYKIAGIVLYLTRGSRIYTRNTQAECIGYVRKRSISNDADNHTHIRWYHSPVFKYMIDGREMIAFYDSLSSGIDSKIPLGHTTIRVNKDDPGSIMNPTRKGLAGSVILIIILSAIGVFLIAGVLSGGVDGSSISIAA